jgi:hypothetical protein
MKQNDCFLRIEQIEEWKYVTIKINIKKVIGDYNEAIC